MRKQTELRSVRSVSSSHDELMRNLALLIRHASYFSAFFVQNLMRIVAI